MISVLIFIGKLILTIVLCTLILIPIIIAMEASSGHYCYKPKSHPAKSSNEVKNKIK
jgi:hypothetical protein